MTEITDLQLLTRALAFAAHKHKNQRRKDVEASPYINHPIALANLLVNEGGLTDTEILCAALLHDTVEDTKTTAEELTEQFGASISDLVIEVTDDKNLSKAERKELGIKHANQLSIKAWAVKLADKTCNLRDVAENPPRDWPLKRRLEYFDWSRAVVDALPGTVWPELKVVFDQAFEKKPTAIARALEIAMDAHRGVTDKAGNPYILHPLKIMSVVDSEEEKIVAVLHDVVEDAKRKGWDFERLEEEGFSPQVLEALRSVTINDGEDYDDFIDRAAKNPIGRKVKIADLKDNMDVTRIGELAERDRERLNKYKRALARLTGNE